MSNSIRAIDASPVSLSYVAALRGVKPRAPQTPFAYARFGCKDIHAFIGLAASNPEGRFVGVVADVGETVKAQALARARQVGNVTFMAELAFLHLAREPSPNAALPPLDYLVTDESETPLGGGARSALFAIAKKHLKPSGLLAISYRAYTNNDESLRFLVNEFAPEMDGMQALEFLHEMKALGAFYFEEHPIAHAALDKAIADGDPKAFFSTCDQGSKARSGTLDMMASLAPLGFAFAGSADPAANYMELAAPEAAHPILEKCQNHLLYELIKDLAANRLVRHDVWCFMPAEPVNDLAKLFGSFTFGLAALRDRLPESIALRDKVIDLRQPVMAKMTEVMALLPMGIGDFLAHPLGQGIAPEDAVAALHTLVAVGIARPMRGHYVSKENTKIEKLKWATAFNAYLDDTPITEPRVALASQIVGGIVEVPARDALVMQAINRAGLADSVDALLLELLRVSNDPALASKIMDTASPTPESAHNMVQDVVSQSLLRWTAYGLLAA